MVANPAQNLSARSAPVILVVDDEPIQRDLARNFLEKSGYRPLCAPGGREALEIVSRCAVDLILLDFQMPRMDGAQFLQSLRANPAYALTPVIMLTGQQDRQAVVKVAKLGVRDYVLKTNCRWDDLLGRIRRHLGGAPANGGTAEGGDVQAPACGELSEVEVGTVRWDMPLETLREVVGDPQLVAGERSGERVSRRIPFVREVTIVPVRANVMPVGSRAKTQDISTTSVSIVSPIPLRRGGQFLVALSGKEAGALLWIHCLAARWQPVDAGAYLVGARFLQKCSTGK